MNNILAKCIEELKQDKPRVDYILGMLETLMEMQEKPPVRPTKPPEVAKPTKEPVPLDDEAALLDAQVRVAMAKIQQLQPEWAWNTTFYADSSQKN